MKKGILTLTAFIVAVAAPGLSQAALINFTATLTVADEFPAPSVPSSANGSLTAILDTDTNVFTWTLIASGLTATTTAVHFHGNTPFPPNHTGLARPVVMGFIGSGVDPGVTALANSLEGNQSGLFVGTADLDLALNDRAGDFPLTVAEQINGLLGTQWYVNIHNANNPAGEIRGQVFLATPTAVPAPAVGWLMGLGVGALVLRTARRRRVLLRG
jgi:hypothetical protein